MMQNPYIFKGSLVFSLVNVQNFEFESGDVHKISFPAYLSVLNWKYNHQF